MVRLTLYNKFFFLLIFLIGFSSFYSQKKFTVVLDAGHGGSDVGANRNYSDIGTVQEKVVTLSVVLKLGRMLEKNKDYKVIYTRKIDEYPSLTYRTDLANRSKADLFIEDNFVKKDKRLSRGVKQANLHVLRMNAMPSILIETGFVNNYDDAKYISTEEGQQAIAESIFNAIVNYKKLVDRNVREPEPEKPVEKPLKNDFRILLMSTPSKYTEDDPALKGLKYILPIKENGTYKYYYGTTNYASIRDNNLKTAKDSGFRNAMAISFVPNQKLGIGYYTLEVYAGKDKLDSKSVIMKTLPDIVRNKENGVFYYTYGKFKSMEEVINLQKELEGKGIINTVIEKKLK